MGLITKIRAIIKYPIREICYSIYRIGYFANLDKQSTERLLELNKIATFNSASVIIDRNASISNHSGDKNSLLIGDNTWFRGQIMLHPPKGKISIGRDCFIGEDTRIWACSEIYIGNRVLISHNVNIHDNISHPLDSKERHKDFISIKNNGKIRIDDNLPMASIFIEDDVWIGFNSSILKGVKIGKGAIIGAHSVITKDVPEFAIVIGNPQKIINYTT